MRICPFPTLAITPMSGSLCMYPSVQSFGRLSATLAKGNSGGLFISSFGFAMGLTLPIARHSQRDPAQEFFRLAGKRCTHRDVRLQSGHNHAVDGEERAE